MTAEEESDRTKLKLKSRVIKKGIACNTLSGLVTNFSVTLQSTSHVATCLQGYMPTRLVGMACRL